jgi:CRISPR-associated protein Cmr2
VTVLNLVNRLQEEYRRIVAEPVSDPKRQENVTASTGIAIAHHYTSLSYVRRTAKSAEELAKDHYGRNALVVTIIRRSGEQTRVGCHWQYPGLAIQPIALFTYFYELFKHNVLSPKCLYTLLEESPVLAKLDREAQEKEIKRVLSRQYADKQEGKLTTTSISLPTLARHLVELANAMDNDEQGQHNTKRAVELHSEKRRYGLVEVLGWLLIMAFLARKDQE